MADINEFGTGIQLSTGFDLGAPKLLDQRCIAADLAERDSMPEIRKANGLLVWVESEQKLYVWSKGAGEWVEVSGSKEDDNDKREYPPILVERSLDDLINGTDGVDLSNGSLGFVTSTHQLYVYVNNDWVAEGQPFDRALIYAPDKTSLNLNYDTRDYSNGQLAYCEKEKAFYWANKDLGEWTQFVSVDKFLTVSTYSELPQETIIGTIAFVEKYRSAYYVYTYDEFGNARWLQKSFDENHLIVETLDDLNTVDPDYNSGNIGYVTTDGNNNGVYIALDETGEGDWIWRKISGDGEETYTTTEGCTAIGGIEDGETFDNVPIREVLDKLLHAYKAPKLSLIALPSVIEAERQTNITVRASATKGSANLTALSVKCGQTSLITKDAAALAVSLSSSAIHELSVKGAAENAQIAFNGTLTDAKNKSVTATATTTAVMPILYGLTKRVKVSNGEYAAPIFLNTGIDEFAGTTKVLQAGSTVTFTANFAAFDEKSMVVITTGTLQSALTQPTNYELKNSFEVMTKEVTMGNGVTKKTFNIYYSNVNSQLSAYPVKFTIKY